MTQNFAYTDPRDGLTYTVVQIADMYWFTENLCYNVPGSLTVEGRPDRFYNGNQIKQAAPRGWKIPKRKDWKKLYKACGGSLTNIEDNGIKIEGLGVFERGVIVNPGQVYFMTAQHPRQFPKLWLKEPDLINLVMPYSTNLYNDDEPLTLRAAPTRCFKRNAQDLQPL